MAYQQAMAANNQIRLVRKGLNDEVIFYLEPGAPGKIHNRMVKFNVNIPIMSASSFITENFQPQNIAPKYNAQGVLEWQYHGELARTEIKVSSAIDSFLKSLVMPPFKKPLPTNFKLYHIGVNVNDHVINGKFGNIEIKFIPNNAQIIPGENPDGMVVLNIHLAQHKKEYESLQDKKLVELCINFLDRSPKYFKMKDDDVVEMLKTGITVRHNFSSSGHVLTEQNLNAYYQALHITRPK